MPMAMALSEMTRRSKVSYSEMNQSYLLFGDDPDENMRGFFFSRNTPSRTLNTEYSYIYNNKT